MAGQRAEARPGDRLAPVSYDDSMRIDPHGTPSVAQLQRIYGDRQLGAALTGYSHETLKAMARQVGAQPGRTSDETVSRITAKMTGGRYTANFRKR